MNVSNQLREILASVQSLCVLTGAGVSAESGVPTFRGDEGIWAKFRPEDLASVDSFLGNPELVWEWYAARRTLMHSVLPNAGHYALARMESIVSDFALVTQNIDDLHARAGSANVIELHGNIMRSLCIDCGLPAAEAVIEQMSGVPRCEQCGGLVRPDVVWFGELLPAAAFDKALEAARRSELFLCVGTSGVVFPAASIPLEARASGAYVVEINPEHTDLSSRMNETIVGKSGDILPALFSIMKEYHDHQQA